MFASDKPQTLGQSWLCQRHLGRPRAVTFHHFLVLLVLAIWFIATPTKARAQDEAQAAAGPPYNVAVFVSTRPDECHSRGHVEAIRKLAGDEQTRINAFGGIRGRPVELHFFDDFLDEKKTIENMRSALALPNLVAAIGLSSSTRGKALFEVMSPELRESGVPFLTDVSVNGIFKDLPNVFSTRPSQEEERAPIVTNFLSQMGFQRVAFVVRDDAVYNKALVDAVSSKLGPSRIASDHHVVLKGDTLDPADLERIAEDLKVRQPDLILVAVGSTQTEPLIKQIRDAGVTPAIFMIGSLDRLSEEMRDTYPNAMYELASDDLPEVYNERMRRIATHAAPGAWIFEGQKKTAAPGWADGTCKEKPEISFRDPFEPANLSAISSGSKFADMVALVASAARAAGPDADLPTRRTSIIRALTTTYAIGRGAYRGRFQNWSFDPQTRVASRPPLVLILPQGLGRKQLAPVQFVRVRNGEFRRIETLYVDVDMIRAHRVDENERSFFAEFYLSMHATNTASIDKIDFTNAYLDPRTNGRQITIEELHGGGTSDAFPATMKVYKVTGRFLFQPNLEAYPFDTQRFAIEMQPKTDDAQFIVQPPPLDLRDQTVVSDDWNVEEQYVGIDEDYVPIVNAYTHEPSAVPFYKASYVWMMKREVTDYFLRVVVPLAFILIVAYVSIFIPQSHFEAIITIQVTALLSAVALYLSLPQLDSDTATLSDRIFLFDYMLVSLMIVISIMRINNRVASRRWLSRTLEVIHIAAIPALVVGIAYYVHTMTSLAPA